MHRHKIFILILISLCVLIQSLNIDLIHRDSILSPFYNHSITPSELLRRAVMRSLNRANNFNKYIDDKATDIESDVIRNEFEYLMKIYVGENRYKALALLSTGSQLTWIQCHPCEDCYEQDAPLFEPSNTYQQLPFDNEFCKTFKNRWPGPSKECKYKYIYEKDGSTVGVLSTETFYLDSGKGHEMFSFPNFVFGCGHENKIKFGRLVQGIVGLGRGKLSLISQLGTNIEHKFSYCFIPNSAETSASKLRFGQEAKISGARVSTPLVFKDPSPYYHLTLEGISVGSEKIGTHTSNNDIIIDSGTVMTLLHSSIYDDLERIIIENITKPGKTIEPTRDPTGTFGLCYEKRLNIKFPNLVFHFAGADIHLKSRNTYVEYFDYICMTIFRHNSQNGISIFGSFAQVNFQVEYDLNEKLVSFAPTDCTKY